ncbi:glycoside hydrolase family 97 protein [Niabella drilacis]|uniref:Alpha-glucosidase n=1 Tax=Niabella drilacis (strain DSM 25811 / CCM 8410 / CCUG 62505 / LMG 26954 / E90) TaxID=1285928 RepID=A0A1G6R5H1_NIADE|nr:glycoside hydrolase family 97 protein [Niabella drilacis]SDC99798.1 alpha-glucosidase [Niabella drilacis]
MRNKSLFFFLLLVTATAAFAQTGTVLRSPDAKIQFNLFVTDGSISYTVSYKGKEVVRRSVMGVDDWQTGLTCYAVRSQSKDTWWTPVYGERSRVRDRYQAKIFSFRKKSGSRQTMQVEVRAYNEGLAFRYSFPKSSSGPATVSIRKDFTAFELPEDTRVWFTDHAQGIYRLLPLNKWPSQAERPLTVELKNGLYAVLAEAEVVNYCRTKFMLDPAQPNTIACSMYDPVVLPTPAATPWRVIMIAQKPTELLANNDLLLNLNPPCAIKNTSWIKPGKVMREITLSTGGAKALVDFAAKRHLQYIHFDAGWYGHEYDTAADATRVSVDPKRNPVNDLDMQEVIRYAKQKGVGVFLYVNQIALAKQLDALLPLYQKWGVAGIKFGFVNVGSFKWTQWLHDAVKKCARYQLMVDIHDEYRPTGFSRTYPNLLTQEGIRGNEEMPDANNNTILPFTRFLAGAADYTICYYHRPELKPNLAATQNARVLKTTSGHQMALSVVYYSPLQFMYWYDRPEDSQDEPELEFFDRVPTVWDDTKVLDGAIGQYVTIARRSGNEWFVGSITNNDARDIKINCSFLAPGKKYMASVYYDDPASPVRTRMSIKRIPVDASTVLDAPLRPSGGQAIWIRPVK